MSYQRLAEHYRRISHLSHVSHIASWDEAVMMPRGGGDARAQAMATLEGLVHDLATDSRISEWILAAKAEALGPLERASLREIERVHAYATALPAKLVEAQVLAQLRCEQGWREQREQSDFEGHRPLLEQVVLYKREEAQILAAHFGVSPYDALLNTYEPGMNSARLDALFGALERMLSPLVSDIIERQSTLPLHKLSDSFPIEQQRQLALSMMAAVGFDFEHGRLDTSHHPFCGGVPEDVRITTRYNESDFTQSLLSVLHETGHAKYEQGLPKEIGFLPVGAARSMGVHESQSLLQEMQVCRGRAFLTFAEPFFRRAFPEQAQRAPACFTTENLIRLCGKVERSYIRVDADEVTYPLHVILRYRIERALIEGKLEVKDIPDQWDAAMQSLLGLSTGNHHKDGCMQDVHWPSGAIGYFPSYTLGALTAAQLFETARVSIPGIEERIARGDFEPLNSFLRERIWSKASLLETADLITQATRRPLGVEAFERHVRERYLS